MQPEFLFPSSQDQLLFVQSKTILKELLARLVNQNGPSISYTIRLLNQEYLYAKCRSCSSKIVYKKVEDGSGFQLKRFHNHHQHHNRRGQHIQLKNQLKKLPNNIRAADAQKLLKNKFQLSRATFYRVFNSIKNESFQIPQLFNMFGENKIFGYYEPIDTTKPSLIIYSSNKMKQAFLKYGQFCSFDITYHLINQKSPVGLKYGVGFIVGINNLNKIVPFAVVVTDAEYKERMAKIFYQFFKMMGKMPNTIITDEQGSISAGLDLLTYENVWHGQHLLDTFHILRNVRKRLIHKENIKFFSQAIVAENDLEFKAKVTEIQENCKAEDKNIITRFLSSSSKYCFSQIAPTLIGFTATTSICEKMNDLIKQRVPLSKSLGIVLKKTYDLCTQLLEKSFNYQVQKMMVQKFFNFQQIEQLKRCLCKKIFERVLRNILKSLHCILKVVDQGFKIHDEFGVFIVQGEKESLSCSCQYSEKTGIPCLHIMKIALLKDVKILDLIHPRWRTSIQENHQISKRQYRPSYKTRRRVK